MSDEQNINNIQFYFQEQAKVTVCTYTKTDYDAINAQEKNYLP